MRYTNACGTHTFDGKAVTITGCALLPRDRPREQPFHGADLVREADHYMAGQLGCHIRLSRLPRVKADLPNLLTGGTDSCTRATTPDASSNTATGITEDPSGVTGRFYWYLVTGLSWTEGSAGNATAGLRTVNSSGGC